MVTSAQAPEPLLAPERASGPGAHAGDSGHAARQGAASVANSEHVVQQAAFTSGTAAARGRMSAGSSAARLTPAPDALSGSPEASFYGVSVDLLATTEPCSSASTIADVHFAADSYGGGSYAADADDSFVARGAHLLVEGSVYPAAAPEPLIQVDPEAVGSASRWASRFRTCEALRQQRMPQFTMSAWRLGSWH
eukprot:XP_001702567.1 predicted protein [Chlamydomonas reinhardtii]